jgi:hypothetical protein
VALNVSLTGVDIQEKTSYKHALHVSSPFYLPVYLDRTLFIMFTMKQNLKCTKRDPILRVKKSTLYAIIGDIEALHERVHEVAYAGFERPLHPTAAMGVMSPPPGWTAGGPEGRVQWGRRPDYPPSPPTSEHLAP